MLVCFPGASWQGGCRGDSPCSLPAIRAPTAAVDVPLLCTQTRGPAVRFSGFIPFSEKGASPSSVTQWFCLVLFSCTF